VADPRDVGPRDLGIYQHRDALLGNPGSACPQPKPNATELPELELELELIQSHMAQKPVLRGEVGPLSSPKSIELLADGMLGIGKQHGTAVQ